MPFHELVNVYGVNIIEFLQRRYLSYISFFVNVSKVGDPSLAFTFYFPLVSALSLPHGVALLWTLILCEWGNMVLKWILAGDRPYWWIHESPYYLYKRLPNIIQFPVTCETGPGMPSGHSTLNAALFFVLLKSLTSYAKPRLRNYISQKQCTLVIRGLWVCYALWICLIMVSRIIIAAHFPHQCLTGVVIGILTASWVSSTTVFSSMSYRKAVSLTFAVLASVGVVFVTYRMLGNDPMWSINKAVRWCLKREYIHVDSSPFYALSRYSGQTLGLGLALSSSFYSKVNFLKFTWKMKASLLILSLATGQAADFAHRVLPSTISGFYVIEFLLNTTLPFLILSLLPRFVMKASGTKPKEATKHKKK